MPRLVLQIAAATALTIAAIFAFVAAAHAADIAIEGAFARASATPSAKSGAAYFTIVNRGDAADRLVAVETDAASMTMLHENKVVDGVASMTHLDAIDVPPHDEVQLAPSGTHVMLMDLKAPLKKGEQLHLTLTFDKAGKISIDVPIGSVAATGP
jgi:periplasmic copper chaperone A